MYIYVEEDRKSLYCICMCADLINTEGPNTNICSGLNILSIFVYMKYNYYGGNQYKAELLTSFS